MNLEKTIKSLEGRGFRVSHFASAAQAAARASASAATSACERQSLRSS